MSLHTVNDLPVLLKDLVNNFARRHDKLQDPDEAAGLCADATCRFLKELAELAHDFFYAGDANWDMDIVDLGDGEPMVFLATGPAVPPEVELIYTGTTNGVQEAHEEWLGHTAAFVEVAENGDVWFIDFTARQFDHEAPFPLIWKSRNDKHELWGAPYSERKEP